MLAGRLPDSRDSKMQWEGRLYKALYWPLLKIQKAKQARIKYLVDWTPSQNKLGNKTTRTSRNHPLKIGLLKLSNYNYLSLTNIFPFFLWFFPTDRKTIWFCSFFSLLSSYYQLKTSTLHAVNCNWITVLSEKQKETIV